MRAIARHLQDGRRDGKPSNDRNHVATDKRPTRDFSLQQAYGQRRTLSERPERGQGYDNPSNYEIREDKMERVLNQSTVYKFFVTTATRDTWLPEEFSTLEEAKAWERANLYKLRKATGRIGDWDIHEVEFTSAGRINRVDGLSKAERIWKREKEEEYRRTHIR